jgi:putative solute:sodium symporter small subunit
VEEQYYFLISLFIFVASKFFLYFFPTQADAEAENGAGAAPPKYLYFLLYIAWLVSFCLCIVTPDPLISSQSKFFGVQFRFWEFLTGAILKLNEVCFGLIG